jgi:hypothetical protein
MWVCVLALGNTVVDQDVQVTESVDWDEEKLHPDVFKDKYFHLNMWTVNCLSLCSQIEQCVDVR